MFRAVKVLRSGHEDTGHSDETPVYNKIFEHLAAGKRASEPRLLHPGLKNLVKFYGKIQIDDVHDGYVLEPLTVDLHCLLALVSPNPDPDSDPNSNNKDKETPGNGLRLDLKAKRAGLPIETVKRFMKGILEGLGFLHEEVGLLYAGESGLFVCNQNLRDRILTSCLFGSL